MRASMRTRMSTAIAAAALLLAGPAASQMMSGGSGGMMMHGEHGQMMGAGMMQEGQGMMQGGHGMMQGGCPMCQMGGMMQSACMADLKKLGLSEQIRNELEDSRFELRKSVIRKAGDLKILQMELQRMLERRDFNLEEVRQKARAVAEAQGDIHVAHLEYLHELGAKLSEEQWRALQGQGCMMMGDGMSGMHGGMKKDGGSGARGQMMKMHHGDSSSEAEEFMEEE